MGFLFFFFKPSKTMIINFLDFFFFILFQPLLVNLKLQLTQIFWDFYFQLLVSQSQTTDGSKVNFLGFLFLSFQLLLCRSHTTDNSKEHFLRSENLLRDIISTGWSSTLRYQQLAVHVNWLIKCFQTNFCFLRADPNEVGLSRRGSI